MRCDDIPVDLELLEETLAERGEPAFRARQVWAWAARGAGGYEEMTDLSLDLRAALAERVPFSTLSVEREAQAADGTVKTLFSTADGRPVEAVLMRYRDGRRSVCVSSQSGCPLTCTFCATGAMRFGRNLSASEILDQVLHFRRLDAGQPPRVHGDGRAADERRRGSRDGRAAPGRGHHAPSHRGLDDRLDPRHRAPGRVSLPLRLALSLHAADEALRSRAHARERALPPRRGARRMRGPLRAQAPPGVRRVRDAGRRQRPLRAGRRPRRASRPARLQGQPDPLQPDRRALRRLQPRRHRGLPRRAAGARPARDRAPHPRPRHRRGLRSARGTGAGRRQTSLEELPTRCAPACPRGPRGPRLRG